MRARSSSPPDMHCGRIRRSLREGTDDGMVRIFSPSVLRCRQPSYYVASVPRQLGLARGWLYRRVATRSWRVRGRVATFDSKGADL